MSFLSLATLSFVVSDIAIFVLKRDVKLKLTNQLTLSFDLIIKL